jgi:rare lipoprotein A
MRTVFAILTIAFALFFTGILSHAEESSSHGLASRYGFRNETANGEMMNPAAMTAAHKTLPFGTRVRVTDESTHRTVVVRINDRGPFTKGYIIDLSTAAARALGIVERGIAMVVVEVVL